jgi:hypothetical protein
MDIGLFPHLTAMNETATFTYKSLQRLMMLFLLDLHFIFLARDFWVMLQVYIKVYKKLLNCLPKGTCHFTIVLDYH